MANTDKMFRKAEKLLQKEKFDAALEIFLGMFHSEPQNEAVLLNLSDLSLKLGRPEDSLRFNSLLADLYIKRKDIAKAIATCRKGLKISPQDVQALINLAMLLRQSGKTTEAAGTFRKAAAACNPDSQSKQALECLRNLTELEPDNLEAHTELAKLAEHLRLQELSATAWLKAAEIARRNGMEDSWADFGQRAHRSDPQNPAATIAAAEVNLAQGHNAEVVKMLEPMCKSSPDDVAALKLLCRAYLNSSDYAKARTLCLKLNQSHPETLGLTEQLIRGLLADGQTAQALELLEGIKKQLYWEQGRKLDFLALAEQIYHADENNLEVLELLPPLYNELNRESELRKALARLFNLYLAGEKYFKAAETLDGMLDVDPYGTGHADRLLNLEGHIDAVRYANIAGRISVPVGGHGIASNPLLVTDEEPQPGTPATLDDLLVEAEMYHRYRLTAKLEEILRKINRQYPGAQEENRALSDLYETTGIKPAPAPPEQDAGSANATELMPVGDLGRISSLTALIHRQGIPERVLSTAAEQLGRMMNSSRCWISAGAPGSTPLTAEYVAPGLAPSDPATALAICLFLTQQGDLDPEGWPVHNVQTAKQLEPVLPQLLQMGIASLLAVPLLDKEQKAGLLLVQQCQSPRHWTESEIVLARTVASQVSIAINSTRLRRLVRSLAGTDPTTGLLPRSAYLDCLLAEARRAEEQSRPLSVCLLEPVNAAGLIQTFGHAQMQSYIQQVSRVVSSLVRQNDIAIRYGPSTIALCLPDTPLLRSRFVIEKLQAQLVQTPISADVSPDFCAAAADLFLGTGFDAVDAVTEIINRLENSMEALRKQPETQVRLSSFNG